MDDEEACEITSDNSNNGGDLKKLPKATVKLITSSQVITSVFSVVKELVENSLDAKATSIDIKLDNCGFDRIEVRDNGIGIKSIDTKYMARPHYTSKIKDTQDLEMLDTYGFRGEALGSLCSLADVAITTKTADDAVSMTYLLSHEGKVIEAKPSHLGQGTTVTVTNLFRNLPVRRQFYANKKKQKEEMKKVEDAVMAFALLSHDVRFCLKHNNNVIWQKQPLADVKSALINVFGVNAMMHMEHVKRKSLETEIEIETFLPKKSSSSDVITRSTGDRFFCYINKRTVVMKDVEKLVRKCYLNSTGADATRYPMGFLHIVLPYKDVDVNLDPNKTRVLLQEKEKVLKFLTLILEGIYGPKGNKATECSSVEQNTSDQISVQQSGREDDSCKNLDISSDPDTGKINLDPSESEAVKWTPADQNPYFGELTCSDMIHEGTENSVLKVDANETNPDANLSDIRLTEELLKEFEDYEQSEFNVSTPELRKSAFNPAHTSTQVESELSSIVNNNGQIKRTIQDLLDQEANDDQQAVDNSIMEGAALKWALGTAVKTTEGNFVEPVQVIKGGQVRDNAMGSEAGQKSPEANICSSSFDTTTITTTTSKNLFSSSFKQSSLFDLSVKKPPSGYLYFSREVRQKVLAENRGASFAEIATIILGKWKALSEEEKQKYEDLASREVQWTKYQAELKASKHQPDDVRSPGPSAKRFKIINKSIRQDGDLKKLFMSSTSNCREQVKMMKDEKIVNFSVSELKKTLSEGPPQSQSQIANKSPLLVGQLLSEGAWVCCHGNCLKLFQPIRAKEELIYRRLMANHKFPTEPLDLPERLMKDFLKPDLWQTLLSLKMSPIKQTDPYCHVIDERIVNNGFRIQHRIDPATRQPVIELVAMTRAISGFDVKVLIEILGIINTHHNVQLSNCRPGIVKHFIQSEAVRMSRQLPPRMSREDVQDLMTDLQCHLVGGTKSCFHGKPILHDLYDLDQLPDSQQGED